MMLSSVPSFYISIFFGEDEIPYQVVWLGLAEITNK